MPTRRELVSVLGFGSATMALHPALALGDSGGESSPEPWWLIAPLKEGSTLLNGWSVSGLGPIKDGAAVLTLGGNSRLRIHLCLHQGEPKGYANSELFDLIVMDHGHSVRTVPEDLAPVLLRLETIIRDNEAKELGSIEFDGLTRLMTHSERVQAFGADHLN